MYASGVKLKAPIFSYFVNILQTTNYYLTFFFSGHFWMRVNTLGTINLHFEKKFSSKICNISTSNSDNVMSLLDVF